MDVVNFSAIIKQFGLIKAAQLVKDKDLVLVGRHINNKRDGSQYREMAMTVEEFISLMGVDQCGLQLETSFTQHPEVAFAKANFGTEVDEISAGVHITRGDTGWLFNPVNETASGSSTPSNTEWAFNPTDLSQLKNMTYDTLENIVIGNLGSFNSLPGNTLAMHDLTTDKYYVITFDFWQSGAGGGGFAYRRSEVTDICDGCITFPDGSKLCTSPSAPVFSIPATDFYVDAVVGNNGTALPNRFDRPYQTIEAALAATTAGVRSLIYVRKGDYSPPTMTFKNLVDFYFEPGTQLLAGGFQDGGVAVTCNVTGGLIVNGFVGALTVTGGSRINFEFDRIITSFFAFQIAPTAQATVTIKGNSIDATPFAGFNFMATIRRTCDVYIHIRDYIISDRMLFFVRNGGGVGFNGTLYIKCPRMTMNGNSGSLYERPLLQIDHLTNAASRITIEGDMYSTGTISALNDACVYMRSGVVTMKGNIQAGNYIGIANDGVFGGTGSVHLTGSVSSNREAIRQSHTNLPILIEQGLLSTLGLGADPYLIIQGLGTPTSGLTSQPNNNLYLKDCRLYNALADSSIANIDLGAGGNNIYFYNCEADSAGALGELITAAGAVTSGFHNVRTRKPNNILVTDLFTPTGVIVDAGVVIPQF